MVTQPKNGVVPKKATPSNTAFGSHFVVIMDSGDDPSKENLNDFEPSNKESNGQKY